MMRWTTNFGDKDSHVVGAVAMVNDDGTDDHYDINPTHTSQSLTGSQSSASLMGSHPPILYEAALIGNWREILQRVQTHPHEVSYQDKCKNTALHLACRRQPPANVIAALLRADSTASSTSLMNNNGNIISGRKTVDGLTPLHFACYCGASEQVIDLLLSYKDTTLHATNYTSTSSSHNQYQSFGYSPKYSKNALLDKRGRTPLHCACAGFRTKHRPAVVQLLLRHEPSWATAQDEKGRTPFTLMYADYAEELEDVLKKSVTAHQARDACWSDHRELNELWKIICLLLKAAYFKTVDDFQDEEDYLYFAGKKNGYHNHGLRDEEKCEEKENALFRSTEMDKNEVDLNYNRFQILHAAAACMYVCPVPIFQLILKVCGFEKVKERDQDFHLPLHCAVRAVPPTTARSSKCMTTSTSHQDNTASFIAPNGLGGVTIEFKTTNPTFSSHVAHLSPEIIFHFLLDKYPEAASIQDETGKFPLLRALETGKPWSTVIEPLIRSYPTIFYYTQETTNVPNEKIPPPNKMNQDGRPTLSMSASFGSKKNIMMSSNHASFNTIATIQASLLVALMSPSVTVRKESALTVGQLMKVWSEDCAMKKAKQINTGMAPDQLLQQDEEQKLYAADEFVKTLVKASGGYGKMINMQENEGIVPTESADDNQHNDEGSRVDEMISIQSNMLHALSEALRHASPDMISPQVPKTALDTATNMLAHEDGAIRGYAAHVIGTALEILGTDLAAVVIQQIVLVKKGFTVPVAGIDSSHHTVSSSVSSVHDDTVLLKQESPNAKHSRAAVCFRILSSSIGESISDHKIIFFEITVLIKILMSDENLMVRKAACLAIGGIIGRAPDGETILKDVRHTILKCMRATEDSSVHLSLAHGLILASKLKEGVFMSKPGIQIIEGALMLSVSASSITVQRMFNAFLWISLGVGADRNNNSVVAGGSDPGVGLSQYMSLAQGENGKIMLNTFTKTLSKIDNVHISL